MKGCTKTCSIGSFVVEIAASLSQVFQKIQKRLSQGLSQQSSEQLEQRLAQQYQEYLHTVNTTAGVFRDTIAAKEYDPLAPR